MNNMETLDAALPPSEPASSACAGAELGSLGVVDAPAAPSFTRPRRLPPPGWSALCDKLSRNVSLQGRALDALRLVDRAEFVLPGSNPYDDAPQRIGHSATISAPHMHAMALRLLSEHLRPGCRALDVGCGSGFLSAVMTHMVGPTGLVVGIDYLDPLVHLSRENVSKSHGDVLEAGALQLQVGDGWKGCPKDGPFDAIHVGAAAAEMPKALIDQLKPGGRMVIPVGQVGKTQAFMQVEKDLQGHVSEQKLVDVMYVPLVQVRE